MTMISYLSSYSKEENDLRLTLQEFCKNYLRPTAIEDDEHSHFRKDVFSKIAKCGFSNKTIPTQWGGGGKSNAHMAIIIEELARASTAMAIVVGVTNLAQGGILAFGTETQKEKFLKPLVTGDWLGAFSLSEPQSGSDAAALRLQATKVEGGYVLNGNKVWCSSAGHADLYLVMGRTSEKRYEGITAFLVPADTVGFRVGKQEKKLGLRASSLAELIFENCFIPDTQRLGKEGEGFQVALSQLDSGRITIGICGLGIAKECLERTLSYFYELEKLGTSLGEGYREELSSFFAEVSALETLIRESARERDLNQKVSVIGSQIKLLGSDLAMKVSCACLTLCGEKSSQKEFELERLFRDAKALQIVEGTNQIQRLVLARALNEGCRKTHENS